VRLLRRRYRTILAALLGTALVALPATCWIYWQVQVEPQIEQELVARLGRKVIIGSARPGFSGVRLSNVVVFGAPPFERVPLLTAGAIDVDVRWRTLLGGGGAHAALRGLTLHRARMAVVRDAQKGGDNVGDLAERLFKKSSSPTNAPSRPLEVRLASGSLELAYRDSGGARWVVRGDDLEAHIAQGSGDATAGRLRVEVAGAAAEFNDVRFVVDGGQVRSGEAQGGHLALAGAEDLLAGGKLRVFRDGDEWRLRAQAPHTHLLGEVGAQGIRLTFDAEQLPLAPLRPLGDPRGVGTFGATASAHLEFRFLPREDALGLEGRAEVTGLTVTNPHVTSGQVSNVGLRIAGSLVASPRRGRMAVDQAVVRLGDLAVWVHGRVEDAWGEARGELEARIDETPCQAALESLPPGFAPALEGAQLTGVLSGHGKFHADATHLEDLVLDVGIKERCVVLRDPPRADVTKLRAHGDVAYRVDDADGKLRDFPLGPGNPDWRSLHSISPHLVGAFLTAEDAGFWSHNGFEPEYIRRALIENLKKGRVVRGASTIPQQLVKNLYLERARTWSRKLQEAALTWRLEQAVPKGRILELYLNAIEMGPGTYGVRQAARRYFGKEPSQLTPLEAAHLASVTPNPKAYWARFHRGPAGDDWMEKLYDLLGMMHRSHRLSDEDFAAAMAAKLHFMD
jgi:hypothetical protein